MDLAILSASNYSFSTIAQAKSDCLFDVINFLTNASYTQATQSQNKFFNPSGNAIYRSTNCFNGWAVYDAAAGTNQQVLRAPYPSAMGAGKYIYVKVSTANSHVGDNSGYNPFSLQFQVYESWNATTHTGINGVSGDLNSGNAYLSGLTIYPQSSNSYQKLILGGSLYNIFAHLHGTYGDTAKWGGNNYYSSGASTWNGGYAPIIVGLLPYAESGGWHTSSSAYPATFASFNYGAAHPLVAIGIPRVKGNSGDVNQKYFSAGCALDASVKSGVNSPIGVPTTTVPGAGGTAQNILAPIVPAMPDIGARFENPNFSFSDTLCDGLFMACSGTGAAYDISLTQPVSHTCYFQVGRLLEQITA